MAHEEFNDETTPPQSSKHVGIITELSTDLLDQMSDGFVAIDTSGLCVYANRKALTLLNIESLDELVGKQAITVFPHVPDHPLYNTARQALLNQEAVEIEGYFDPWDRWYQLRIFPYDGGIKVFFNEISERKRVETTLKERNEQLTLTLRAANVGLWDWDLQTNEVYFSPEWKKQIGYEDHEISNAFQEWESRVHPDDLATAMITVETFLANPYPDYHNEFRFRHKDGTYRWILAQADLLSDDEGKPIRMLGSHIDVTRQKEMQSDIDENERRFSTIFHLSPIPTALIRVSNSHFVDVNDAMEMLTGYSQEEMLGKSSLDLNLYVKPAVRQELADRIEDAGLYNSIEMHLRQKSGEIRDVIISSEMIEFGSEMYVIAMANDITERKQAEEALRKSEEKFRGVYEQSPIAIQIYNGEGKLIDVNQQTLNMYGVDDKKYLLGYDMWSSPNLTAEKNEALKQGQTVFVPASLDFERIKEMNLFPTNRSGIIHMEMYAIPFVREGDMSGYLVQIVDVTEGKQAERDLIESEKRYRTLFENMNAGFVLFEVVAGDDGVPVDLIIRAANNGFEQTTGLSIEECIDKPLTQVLPGIEDDTADWIGTYGTIALTGESRQFVQGSELLGYYYSVSAFQALPKLCAVTFVDITQRKQTEEALKFSERRFRTLIEQSSDILLLIDSNSEILYTSPAVEMILGYTPEEFSRLDRLALVHADDFDNLMAQVRWSMDHPGEVIEGEHRVRHKDGRWRTFRRILRNLLHDPAINALVSNLSDITERKRAEEALRESEEKYRSLVDHASDGIFVSDAEGYYIEVNPSGSNLLGYLPEELVGKHLGEFIDPENMQSLPLRLDAMKSGKSTVTERVLKHKDGTLVDVEISGKMLPNGYLLGMVRDIGERKRAEEALRAREERFRLAMENIPDVVVIYDTDLRIQFINNATTVLTGRPVSDYIGYRDDELWSPEVYETYLPALEEAVEFKRMTSVEIDITVPGGSPLAVVVTCVPILDRDNNVREILGITHNLTERKRAEQALQRYNQRLTALRQIDKDIIGAQSARNIVNAVLDSVSELIPCQRASVTLIDKERSEVVVYAIVADDESRIIDGIRNPLPDSTSQQLLERGDSLILSDLQHLPEPISDLVKQLIKEGQRSLIAIPMLVQSEFIGSLNLSTNLRDYFTTEHEEILREIANQLAIAIHQSRLNEQIKNMNQVLEQRVVERTAQLESKNRELETFTYTVSHDLKAPLRGIDGYSRLLLEDYRDILDEQGQTFLHNVRSATEQMNQLIDDLLAYSRLERRSLKAMALNLRHVAESIVAERQRDIDEKSANVSISVPDMVASVDSDGFNMALRNLLDNALKFIKIEQPPIIEIGGYEEKDTCVLWVKDNGIGFDMKYHDRILQIFHRLHRSEDYAGTGIGLAIVQKAMERMGGRIWAESEPDTGSKFYLEMPK